MFVCKAHYISCLREELGLNSTAGNPTYTCTPLTKEEILSNHKTVLLSFGINTAEEELERPKLYWIPKLHKAPYKQWYIAGSARCSTKSLSQILTKILTTVKDGLQKYCNVSYARSGVNQMWILKIRKNF